MANWKKFKKFVQKVAKPVAAVAAIAFPALIPAIGASITGAAVGTATASIAGAAALSGAASAISGDSTQDILKNAVLAGGVAGISQAVSGSGLLGGDSGIIPAGTSAGGNAPVEFSRQQLAELSGEVSSKGLLGGVVDKVASFTGLTPDTVGKLGVAGVQSLLSSAGANKQAEQARQAAQTSADAQIEAARIAADAAKFRPVGVTTRFGQSAFTTDAEGNVIGAGYAASPEIRGYQDRLSTLAGQGMTDIEGARAAYQPLTGAAQSLFSLGNQYLAKSPDQAAADYISKQQALISPSRQNQLAELQNRLFQQGRGGAATAQGGNLMATSPELAAYYNALAQQDLVLAAEADQAAQQRIQFGSGLFDTGANLQGRYYTGQTAAYQPFATAMDTSIGLESLAQQPLEMGVNIGGRTTAGTAAGGRFLSEGITNAAATMAPANAYSASGNLLSGFAQNPMVGSALNNAFGVQPQQKTYTAEDIIRIFGT
jgi:hypothetical protein